VREHQEGRMQSVRKMEVGGATGGSPELRLVAEKVDTCCEGCASSVIPSVSPCQTLTQEERVWSNSYQTFVLHTNQWDT